MATDGVDIPQLNVEVSRKRKEPFEDDDDGGSTLEKVLKTLSGEWNESGDEIGVKPKGRGGRRKKPGQNASYEEYKEVEIIEFLGLIEPQEVIWNQLDKRYNRKDIKMATFNRIEEKCWKFMTRGKPHGRSAENLWNTLSGQYQIERKRMENPESDIGTPESNFPFLAHMSFLDSDRKSVQNVNVSNGEESSILDMQSESGDSSKMLDLIVEQIGNMNRTFELAVEKLLLSNEKKNGPSTSPKACESSRICSVYSHIVQGLSEMDKIKFETIVLNHLFQLQKEFAKRS